MNRGIFRFLGDIKAKVLIAFDSISKLKNPILLACDGADAALQL